MTRSVSKDGPIPWLKGTDLERHVSTRLAKYKDAGLADIRRSGVQATMKPDGHWEVVPSRPDFEGHFRGPIPVCFDCKVCSQASFPLDKYRWESKGSRRYQLAYMFDKARYDVRCFFLIHWNARSLATKSEEAATYAFPVHPDLEFWQRFHAREVKSINRLDCEELGVYVPWTVFGDLDRTRQPDVRVVV